MSNERAFEAIAKQLKEAIYSGKLKPGDKLPTERELAKMFSSSGAAVRSAVLSLEQSRLLKMQKGAGGGLFVQELDFRPIRNSLNDLLRLGEGIHS
ncbi:MAG: winged helix-turn-helix transcriptional regulator [Deltaproteobacteria bacterium]|nr:winged helix-turn-helix transcriptional regulator [Deltaproteobacteria bacterium]